jgi:type I restriction enzyme, S subunit
MCSLIGWRRVLLGDAAVAVTMSGGTPSRTNLTFFGGSIKWVKSGELDDNWIFETEEMITCEGLQKSSAKVFPVGTLLVAMYGATAGKTAILKTEAATNQAVCAIIPQNGAFDCQFLQYQLILLRPRILRARSGGAQPNISQRVLSSIEIRLPPVDEQRAIAHALRVVQEAKQARQRELALERERKAVLMQYLFTHGTRGEQRKQTEIGELPKSWRLAKLESVATLLSGGTPSKQRKDWWEGTIPWVSPKDLKQPRLTEVADYISDEALANGSRLVPAGTIFLVVRGMILAKDVPTAIAEVPMAFNQDLKAIVPRENISAEYLFYAVTWRKSGLTRSITTSAHGTRRLGSSAVSELLIPVAPREEQMHIAEILRLCEEKTTVLQREVSLMDELFRGMLEALMTGQLSAAPLIKAEAAA